MAVTLGVDGWYGRKFCTGGRLGGRLGGGMIRATLILFHVKSQVT
jgi:hypothetical protein